MVVQNTIEIQLGFANANTRVQPIIPNMVAQNTMRTVGQSILNVQMHLFTWAAFVIFHALAVRSDVPFKSMVRPHNSF